MGGVAARTQARPSLARAARETQCGIARPPLFLFSQWLRTSWPSPVNAMALARIWPRWTGKCQQRALLVNLTLSDPVSRDRRPFEMFMPWSEATVGSVNVDGA